MPGSELPDARALFPADTQIIKASSARSYAELRRRAHVQIDRMLADEHWDVVHDHMGAYLTAEPGPAIPAHVGSVLSVYGLRSNPHYSEIYRRAGIVKAHRRFVATACSCDHRRHLASTLTADHVIRHAVPERTLLDVRSDPVLTVYWAAIMPGKAQLEVAQAARQADARVVFAGPLLESSATEAGYARRFLATARRTEPSAALAAIDKRSLVSPATYIGEVFDPSLQEALFARGGRFLLCATHEEPFSLAILEAMAYGLPVAAGPFHSAREALGGVGHFVESLERSDIITGLRWVGPPRTGVQAYARRSFSIAAWASRWDSVYRDAIGRRGGR
jgi:glycosyltransferase involved in cell wall biosynthesis